MARVKPITHKSRGPRVKALQKGIRQTLKGHGFEKWAKGVQIDGDPGPLTMKMAKLAGSMQGLSKQQLKKIDDGTISRHAELILTHEKQRSREMKRREKRRDENFDKMREELKHPPPPQDGVVTFDGKPCAAWIAADLQEARDKGLWGGVLISGYRTPAYSTSLCYGICGAPSCPGRCAGASSNHSKYVRPEGAADVSDYVRCEAAMRQIGSPLHNAIGPSDPNHLSASGN